MARPTLNKIKDKYDVIVIGAGATGCATARELATKGFSVLLLDRSDIGSGTSSRSSRLLYCGLGYMKPEYSLWKIPFHPIDMMGRIYRAWLTMKCRTELVREMPEHLTRRSFYFPYAGHGGGKYPDAIIDLGYRVLSLFGSKDVPLGYHRLTIEQAVQDSGLARRLGGKTNSVGKFYEYQYSWPERICVDTALDAERLGATVRNYTEVKSISYSQPFWNVKITERAPGVHGEKTIKARMVVNTAGPWVDNVLGRANPTSGRRQVLGVKGVNVMVKLPEEFQGQGLESFSSRGEPFYIFPWGDMHFIGPTEERVDTAAENERVRLDDIDYLLNEANTLLPKIKLTRKNVLHFWCGVRPSSTRDGKALSGVIQVNESTEMPNFISVTGVMIMLHRHAARLAAKKVESKLGKIKRKSTIKEKNEIRKPSHLNSLNEESIKWLAENEHVVTLSDLIRRRLPLGWESDLGMDSVDAISEISAKALGWTENRRKSECNRYHKETLENFMMTEDGTVLCGHEFEKEVLEPKKTNIITNQKYI